MTSFWNNRIRFRNYRHTRFSGIDREMRIRFDEEFRSLHSMRRNYFALKQFHVKEQWALYHPPRRISTGKGFRKTNTNGKGKRTMGKIAFTVTSPQNLLSEEDVYDVVPELSSR